MSKERAKSTNDKDRFWKVLIVDDDNFSHRIIKEINKGIKFEGKEVVFYSAFTLDQAKKLLAENNDMALVLLDLVLEDQDSGLRLVRYMRDKLNNQDIRIVLITGKNSSGLEEKIILNYDINGYEDKSDLFSRKMNTVVLSALRGYRDINRIKSNRKAMENVVESVSELYKKDTIEGFLSTSICQLNKVINQCENTKKCEANSFAAIRQRGTSIFKIIDGRGKYKKFINNRVRDAISESDLMKVSKVFKSGDHEFFNNCYISRYRSKSEIEVLIFVEVFGKEEQIDMELLDVFNKSIVATFDNLCLNLEIEETQKEILYTLGEVTEARSEEAGFHVKRVSKYCRILAEKYGLSERETILLTHAAPIHDIGKIGIPDNILLKPGKLTKEEFELMKTHTTIGYNLLKNSNREILQTAAIMAKEHHEKYDGTGYPEGLKGKEIHIYGRIAAVADVFDALGSPRIYKNPWVINDILKYFKEERGKHFDPDLIDILFENLDEFLEIKEKYSDEFNSKTLINSRK